MKKFIFFIITTLSFPLHAELKWEKVSEGVPNGVRDVIYRAYVPHGWLLVYTKKSLRFANETIDFGNITFYPDETHEWTL
jgi:hypothetical protein